MIDQDTLKAYRRGVESGIMKSATPNVVRQLLDEIDELRAELASLPPSVHKRKCHECGNVAWHADNRTPYVNCRMCGSQDTRKVKT